MTNNNLPIVLCTALCTALYAGMATYTMLDIVMPEMPVITIEIKIKRNFLNLVGGLAVGVGSLNYLCK